VPVSLYATLSGSKRGPNTFVSSSLRCFRPGVWGRMCALELQSRAHDQHFHVAVLIRRRDAEIFVEGAQKLLLGVGSHAFNLDRTRTIFLGIAEHQDAAGQRQNQVRRKAIPIAGMRVT
jgi:hypothetical protein